MARLTPVRIVVALLGAALGASGTGACGAADRSGALGDGPLTILYVADERVFSPYWDMEAKFLVFLPLIGYDENGGYEGRLAHAWDNSEDYRDWTFHLRSDVRWHDGAPVTARDVVFSLRLYAHPDVLYDDVWHDVDSMTAVDDTTLKIRFRRAKMERNWTWVAYLPEHLLRDEDPARFFEWEFWLRPVGNGPYRYVRHLPKTMVELEANPDYYRGPPEIRRVILRFGAASALTELLAGNAQVLTWVNRSELPKLAADPRYRVVHHIWPEFPWLMAIAWNQRAPALRDPAVRRALTHGIDRPELRRILEVPDDVPLVDAPFTRTQYARGELPAAIPFDPARARTLLDSAGWRDADGDGIRERAGEPLRIGAVVAGGHVLHDAAIYIQAALRRVGVALEVEALENSLWRRRMRDVDYDALFFPYYSAPASHARQLGEESRIGYREPRLTELLRLLPDAPGPEAEDRLMAEIAAIIRRDVPMTFLFPDLQTYVVDRRLVGLTSPFRGDPVQFLEFLRWDDDPPIAFVDVSCPRTPTHSCRGGP